MTPDNPQHASEDFQEEQNNVQTATPEPDETKEHIVMPEELLEFHVVGIGASAGGLEAFEQFFTHLPPDSGAAFVLVPHLDPSHKSIMVELLQKHTPLPVYEIEDETQPQADAVYVIPPNKSLALFHGTFHLFEPTQPRGKRLHIDAFFQSLAADQKERAIAIVLSGTGTDGTKGIREINSMGGMVMVQEPTSAQYDGMPYSAINTGIVDYVLPPAAMPAKLVDYIIHFVEARRTNIKTKLEKKAGNHLDKIFLLLRSTVGHDFSYYKRNTILRRIERRMHVHQLDEISGYVRYLQQDTAEVKALFKDLLIGVTGFFRDPHSFVALEEKVLPELFASRSSEQALRIWVPGCATGEEAYSIAILLLEYMAKAKQSYKVQIFATDIDEDALEKARSGLYSENIAADVSSGRLRRFFTAEEGAYRINKNVRDLIVFAGQNLVKDPPFSKLDLIVCRNVLIYMNQELQRKIIPLFHYSLNPGGYLALGSAETIGDSHTLFAMADKKWKIFRRKEVIRQPTIHFPVIPADIFPERAPAPDAPPRLPKQSDMIRRSEIMLLHHYVPAATLVDDDYEIVHVFGSTGAYLTLPAGKPTQNIIQLAREGLRFELRSSLHQAQREGRIIRRENIRVKTNGGWETIHLIIRPLSQERPAEGLLLVVFEDATPPETAEQMDGDDIVTVEEPVAMKLEQELKLTRERLQLTIEELESSNEELKSSNEELLSINEELQSTTEELETSKEEMQSVNEELMTVNVELQSKVEELTEVNSDLNNFLISTEIATIFLDMELNIRRFTPTATELFKLIKTDSGRPLEDINHKIVGVDLTAHAESTLQQLERQEVEVQTEDGQWYIMSIMPYRTIDNRIDGVVMTFVNVTRIKEAEEALKESQLITRRISDTVPQILVINDLEEKKNVHVSGQLTTILGYAPEKVEELGLLFFENIIHPDDRAHVEEHIHRQLDSPQEGDIIQVEYRVKHRDGSWRWLKSHIAVMNRSAGGAIKQILSASQDVTERKEAEETLQQAHALMQQQVEERTAELVTANRQLRAEIKERHEAKETARIATQLLENAFASLDVMIAYLDPNFGFRRVNPQYAEVYAQEPDYFKGKNYFELHVDNVVEQAVFRRVIKSGQPHHIMAQPIELPGEGDDTRYWDWTLQPVKTPAGEITGILLSMIDVTEREMEIREARDEKQQTANDNTDA